MTGSDFTYTGIEEELSAHGACVVTTKGRSMQPLFKTRRDAVVIKRAEGELKKYDVALYRAPERTDAYILHRVIAVRADEYIIRGDNTYKKEHVPKDAVVGVLVSFNRKGKRGSVENFGYKLYSRFWNFIYPIRFLCAKCRALLGKIYRGLFGKRKNK